MSKNRIAELEKPSNGQAESPLVTVSKKRIAAIDATIPNLKQEMQNLAAQYQQREAIVKELERERSEIEGAIP